MKWLEISMKTTKHATPFILISVLTVIVISCSNTSSQSVDVASLIDVMYQTGPEISLGGTLEAWINNMSSNCISFPADFGITVFVKQRGEWIEVSNQVTYVGDRPEVLHAKGDARSDTLVYIKPDTSDLALTEPVEAYGLIKGTLCNDENHVVEKKILFVIAP